MSRFDFAQLYGPIAVVAVACVLLAWLGIRKSDTWLSAPLIVAAALAFFFVGRPLYVLSRGETSIGSRIDTRPLNYALVDGFRTGMWMLVLFTAAVVIGLMLFTPKPTEEKKTAFTLSANVCAIVTVVTLIFAAASLALAISSAGSISEYVDGLAVRSRTLRGQSFLTLAYLPLAISSSLLIVANSDSCTRLRDRRLFVALSVLGFAFAMLSAAASGGRSAVILTCILPLIVVLDAIRKVSLRTLLASLVGITILFIGLSVGLRDRQFGGQQVSVVDSTVNAVSELPTTLWGQQDARPFDSVLFLSSPYADDAPLLLGSTYWTTWSYFVPRALWNDKPFDGGNAVFTRTFNPRFYSGNDRIETSVSVVGEAWLNFRWIGVLVAGLIFGAIVAAGASVRDSLSASHLDPGIVLYAFSIPILVSAVRGDTFHNVPLFVIVGFLWLLMCLISGKRSNQIREVGSESS